GFRKTDDPEVHAALVERINEKILRARRSITQVERFDLEGATTVVVAYGFTARSARYAVRELRKEGKPFGLLRLKTLWPFPDREIEGLPPGVERILVPEMNRGQVAGEIRKHTGRRVVSLCQTDGEIIHPGRIMEELRRLV
ncbi:MAG: 2-oxoacid:acceptor oxidoreductase subunit alpha, partial [Deltaproteobacteria bacterium]|nr:2-oxoacid:acceptor oxidoreductase subunit alpha [Deltaproteobacteria bacterium]